MKLEGFEVYVHSDGEKLPEYQVKVDQNSKQATCFIPSQTGKSFEVKWNSSINDETSVDCYIDGRRMGASLCSRRSSGSRFGVRITPTQRLPFIFSKLDLVDDENAVVDNSILSKLGTIEIIVTRAIRIRQTHNRHTHWYSRVPNNIGPLHEKSKKVGGHCVSLGNAVTCPPQFRTASRPLNPAEGHWAKFVFQYRPQELLRAQGIAESSNKPRISPTNKLKRRRSSASPKPEPTAARGSGSSALDSPRPNKKVKTEPRHDAETIDLTLVKEGEPPKLLDPSLHGTVIDLTLDDD